nr:hypothetical protein [Sphingomonas melonis]
MVLSRLQTGLARWRSEPPSHARFGDRFDAPPPPPKALAASEVPRVAWMLATRWRHAAALAAVPQGAGGTVMILPGLFDADAPAWCCGASSKASAIAPKAGGWAGTWA